MAYNETNLVGEILDFITLNYPVFAWRQNTVGVYDPKKRIFRKNNSKHFKTGVSDILGLYAGGVFFAMEVKMPGREETLTETQENFLVDVASFGGVGGMVNSIDSAKAVMEDCKSLLIGRGNGQEADCHVIPLSLNKKNRTKGEIEQN